MNRSKYSRIIAMDIDDTVLSLMPSWLNSYNRKFKDKLKPEDITNWNISQFVVPEAKQIIYDYVHKPLIFRKAKPVEGALEAVEWMRSQNSRIIYVTASNPKNVKFEWLLKNGFLKDEKDFVVAYDKSLILADYLIDDKFENVDGFRGTGILFNRPWNMKYKYHTRIQNWNQFLKIMRKTRGGNLE